MSADVVNLQAQVETLLGTLVKAASVELIKLFESRYRALDVGPAQEEERNGGSESPCAVWNGDRRRSIGVQVEDDDIKPDSALLDTDCLRKPDKVEGCPVPPEVQPAEDTDHQCAPLKHQVDESLQAIIADSVDTVELSGPEAGSPGHGDAQKDVALPVSAEAGSGTSKCGSTQTSRAKQKPLLIQPDTRSTSSGEKVNFVCPLILTPDSSIPAAESSEKPVQAEPQQACVSTAKGTAYSPSSSDGAATPAQAGVWERIHSPKDTKNHLQMKLKLTYPDQKLLLPCAVQLVNLLSIPETWTGRDDAAKAPAANSKPGWTTPKDLRRHQGPHTGHRLCCFTRCGSDIWRLQNIVTHSREGYVCDSCGKAFKRRKILRRHERFHTGAKPYPCSKCSKAFALRKSLRRHMRFHTGERPHACAQCGKSFRLRDNLKAHLRFHSGEKPFSCAKCGKTFRIMRNLEKHNLSQCEFFVPSFRKIAGLGV